MEKKKTNLEKIKDIQQNPKGKEGRYIVDMRILEYPLQDILRYVSTLIEIEETPLCSVCKKKITNQIFILQRATFTGTGKYKYKICKDDYETCSLVCMKEILNRVEKDLNEK